MKKSPCSVAILAAVAVFTIPAVAAEEIRFSGTYLWSHPERMKEGDLDVVFTATGEDAWNVAFHFEWEGEDHTFEGTATGSLDGKLTGNVDSDDPGHPLKFEFKGSFSDGTFRGTHGYFNRDGELVDSGTLELDPAD